MGNTDGTRVGNELGDVNGTFDAIFEGLILGMELGIIDVSIDCVLVGNDEDVCCNNEGAIVGSSVFSK